VSLAHNAKSISQRQFYGDGSGAGSGDSVICWPPGSRSVRIIYGRGTLVKSKFCGSGSALCQIQIRPTKDIRYRTWLYYLHFQSKYKKVKSRLCWNLRTYDRRVVVKLQVSIKKLKENEKNELFQSIKLYSLAVHVT
jgi:hypothetical protein